MLITIKDIPKHVLGIKAVGTVTGFDYTHTLIPLVEENLKNHDTIRMIYFFGDEFESFKNSALIKDMKLGLKYYAKWEKIAIVTDITELAWFAKITGFFFPGAIKSYSTQSLEKAIQWIKE